MSVDHDVDLQEQKARSRAIVEHMLRLSGSTETYEEALQDAKNLVGYSAEEAERLISRLENSRCYFRSETSDGQYVFETKDDVIEIIRQSIRR